MSIAVATYINISNLFFKVLFSFFSFFFYNYCCKVLDADEEDKFINRTTLKRTDSELSFSSAVSSLQSIPHSFIGRKKAAVVPVNVPELREAVLKTTFCGYVRKGGGPGTQK